MSNYINQFICGHDGDALEISNEATSGFRNPASWLVEWATGGKSDAGVRVNGYTALTHCPLWQGVNIIAGDFGQTPVRLLKDDFNEQRNHPAWNLLRVRPNELQTPSVWKETMMQWALIWGNGVSWVRRQGSRPVELIPLRPDCLQPDLVAFEDQQYLIYKYYSPYTHKEFKFLPDDVVHFQGLSGDGVWGYALHTIAKNTIGHGLALEKHGNRQFANGARPSGVLKHPNKLTPEAQEHLRRQWYGMHQGVEKAGNTAILQEGMEFIAMQMSNIDSQWIDAKKIGVYEAASLLNLPPHKLGALQDSSVRANLEEQNADYVNRTLNRWYNRADEEYRRKLLTTAEWMADRWQFKHDSSAFMKGDPDTTTTIADRCIKAEVMNRNEGRAMIGLPPYPGGEKFGSPAINPQPNDGASSPDNGRPKNQANNTENTTKPRQATADIQKIRERLAQVMQRERAAILSAAASEKNFVEWLDRFYGSDDGVGDILGIYSAVMKKNVHFRPKSGLLRASRERFVAWCKDRKELLLDICDVATADTLVCEIRKSEDVQEVNLLCDEIVDLAEGTE